MNIYETLKAAVSEAEFFQSFDDYDVINQLKMKLCLVTSEKSYENWIKSIVLEVANNINEKA